MQLKALRERAGLTVRGTADALEMPASSYAVYEDTKRFKKSLIPVPLAQKLADLFERHGVDRSMVLRLAGLDAGGDIVRTPEALADQLDAVLLPEIDVEYGMGGGTDVSDFPVVQHVPFSRSWLATLTNASADHLFVARGYGDSMMPTILDGDIVIFDRSERVLRSQDRIWALIYGGFGMLKRLRGLPNGNLQINSDNPAVSSIEASEGEAFLVGRVIAIVRKM